MFSLFEYSQLIGRFRGATQLYARVPGVEINWPNGHPPDVPRCGFRNDQCIIQGRIACSESLHNASGFFTFLQQIILKDETNQAA